MTIAKFYRSKMYYLIRKYICFSDITTQKMEFTGETSERPRMIRRNTWTKLEGDILVILLYKHKLIYLNYIVISYSKFQ